MQPPNLNSGKSIRERAQGIRERWNRNRDVARSFNRELNSANGKTVQRPNHFNGKRAQAQKAFETRHGK